VPRAGAAIGGQTAVGSLEIGGETVRIGNLTIGLKKPKPRPADRGTDGRFAPGHNTPGRGRKKKAEALQRMEAKIAELNIRTRYEVAKARATAVRRGAVADEDTDVDHLTVAQAKKLGLRLTWGPKNAPLEEQGFSGFLKGFLSEDAGKSLAAMLGGQLLQGGRGPALPAAPQPQPPAAAPTPRPEPTPQPPAPDAPADEAVALPTAEVSGPVALQSRIAINMLAGKTPPVAAATIASIPAPEIAQVLEIVRGLPDEGVMPWLAESGQRHPHLAGISRWLALHPAWTLAVVAELRGQQAQQAG
jgi:hypothetical protein